jgi:hypothetical protein
MPPGPEDADADAFARACRDHEWSARLDNLARLHEYEEHGRLEYAE